MNTSYESTTVSKAITNETFYLQVVEKLRQIADDCLSNKSSSSSASSAYIENIPFIDDEDQNDETIMSVSFDSHSTNTFSTNELNICLNGNKFLSSTKNTNNSNNNNNCFNKVLISVSLILQNNYFN